MPDAELRIRHSTGAVIITPCIHGTHGTEPQTLEMTLEVIKHGPHGTSRSRQQQSVRLHERQDHCSSEVRQSLREGEQLDVRLELRRNGELVLLREARLIGDTSI